MIQSTDLPWRVDGSHAHRSTNTASIASSVARRLESEPSLAEAEKLGTDQRGQFLAMVLHELRNPLGIILAAVDVLRDAAAGGANPLSALPVLERAAGRVMDLSGDLLDLCQTTHPTFQLHLRPIDLAAAAQGAVELRRPNFEHAEIRIEVEAAALPVNVMADPARLELVLFNLLDNALKYTGCGGRVTVLVEAENSEAVLRVRDTGVGIAPEVLPFVFEPFVQEGVSAHKPRRGWGVGLLLLRTLVELHGGRVEASSAGPQCGSEFVVRLPAL